MYALLIDTVSIQKFIFGSNKLRENIGASFLVQQIFERNFLSKFENKLLLENDGSYKGYVGGGNALFFFNTKEQAVSFVKEWSKKLLIDAPGLNSAIAINEFNIIDNDDPSFGEKLKQLFVELNNNKAEYVANTMIAKHGITADCERSGNSKDVYVNFPEKSDYYSSSVNAKYQASKKALDTLTSEYEEILGNKYTFSNELEDLGRSKEEDSHLATVHIDGNSMGEKFQKCKTLSELKLLSKKVETATKESFKELLINIIKKIELIKEEVKLTKKDSKKTVLPIRPIILGGDDITFVCDGRLGIYFAKIFMEEFEKHTDLNNERITSCAGISITNVKYPFFRSYQIAEQLCSNAKKIRNDKKSVGSWIDFHLSTGTISGTIDDIRDRYYKNGNFDLINRPYQLGGEPINSFEILIENTSKLFKMRDKKQLIPQSKIKELRTILTLDESARKKFLQELKVRNHILPTIEHYDFGQDLFQEGKTIYLDMIEFFDLYPKFELN